VTEAQRLYYFHPNIKTADFDPESFDVYPNRNTEKRTGQIFITTFLQTFFKQTIMKNLNPNFLPKNLINEGEVKRILYMAGSPRSYRLDLSKGYLNLNGITAITKPKEEFQVIPIAIRTIEANLFNQGQKKWCEFFFLNEESHVCCFMFHEYSLDNFREQFKELYYDEIAPTDARWKISFDEKLNKDGNKYFIANFAYEMLKPDEVAIQVELVSQIKKEATYIFRADTAEHPSTYKIGYSSPQEPTQEDLKLEAEKRQSLLDEVFPIPEKKEAGKPKSARTRKPRAAKAKA